MADYKSAKEAFHADNPGSSVYNINAISITALSAYALYATTSRRFTSPILDWFTIVLPLLLGVTVFSNSPYAFNGVLIGISLLLGVGGRPKVAAPKPAGRWLNESDSEDEGDMDDGDYGHSHEGGKHSHYNNAAAKGIKLPSEVVAEEAQRRRSLEFSPMSSSSSPGLSLDIAGTPRRRASPSPITPHAAIDIGASPPTSPEVQGHFARSQARVLEKRDRDREREREHLREREHRLPASALSKTHLPFLTVYRSHMMVMTVNCILAVDFPVFPRALGKCEDFGTGLMDVGVGSFVFSLGIVSSKAFSGKTSSPWIKICFGALRNAAPVLALGFIRLLMVKGVEYPEHLTEYGVHWNFFFTLGLVPALCSMLMPLRRKMRWSFLAVCLALFYQLLLTGTSLQHFLLSPDRPGLLGANKEGLASVPGYLAIFMIGLSAGEHVMRVASAKIVGDGDGEENGHNKKEDSLRIDRVNKRKTELALELAAYAAMTWAALGFCYVCGIVTSRRFANLPYVLWTVAYNTSYLTGYLALELFLFSPSDRACPPLLDAVNKNGLVVFLVANVLTGLINVSVQTMYAGTTKSMLILSAYSAGVCAIAWAMRGMRIKL